jgi:hypothetical protein
VNVGWKNAEGDYFVLVKRNKLIISLVVICTP